MLNLANKTILIGKNGAGKTQLLHIIEGRQYINRNQPQATATVNIEGGTVNLDEIIGIFNWDMPSAPQAGMAQIHSEAAEILNHVNTVMGGNLLTYDNSPKLSIIQREELMAIAEELKQNGYSRHHRPTIDDILPMLSSNFSKKSAQILNERIAVSIYDWHVTALENQRDFNSEDNPIKVFNKLCRDFETDYELSFVEDGFIRRPYSPELVNRIGDKVNWNELSSGEQVIFRIICWLYYNKIKNAVYPKLMLLDEPDAHLTPKMIVKLMDSINLLVNEIGVTVILTTHSPNTIALSDESALFELSEVANQKVIEKARKEEAIREYSEGLLFIQEESRLIFVEGKDDVPFYNMLYRNAVLRHELKNLPSLKFIAASVADEDHGGVQEVTGMIPKFESTSIENMVWGLIDRDNGNKEDGNIKVISRYCIENYLYDPLLILISLIIQGNQRNIQCLRDIQTGDYKQLLDDSTLRQTAIDEITETLKNRSRDDFDQSQLEVEKVTVEMFTSHGKVCYLIEKWWTTLPKNDLKSKVLFSQANPISQFIERSKQCTAIDTISAIDSSIYSVFSDIQNS